MKPSITLGVAAFLRLFMPGIVVFIFSWPLFEPIYRKLNLFSFVTSNSHPFAAIDGVLIATISFLFGLIVSLLDDPIYKLYEGIRLWPRWLRELLRSRLDRRVKSLYQLSKAVRYSDKALYEALWTKMRAFPLDEDGVPYAMHPTRLGNILYAYENYPYSRYEMDGVFYFPRLWAVIDEYNKKEFRTIEANSEAPLYISFVSAIFALMYLLLALVKMMGTKMGFEFLTSPLGENAPNFILWGGIAVIVWLAAFYTSLPLHIVRGEHFKALFDTYREILEKRMPLSDLPTPSRRARTWRDKWFYLQYRYVSCPVCRLGFPSRLSKCPHCGTVESYKDEVLEYQRKAGKKLGDFG